MGNSIRRHRPYDMIGCRASEQLAECRAAALAGDYWQIASDIARKGLLSVSGLGQPKQSAQEQQSNEAEEVNGEAARRRGGEAARRRGGENRNVVFHVRTILVKKW